MGPRQFLMIIMGIILGFAVSVTTSGNSSNSSARPTMNIVAGGILTQGTDMVDQLKYIRKKGKIVRIKILSEFYKNKLDKIGKHIQELIDNDKNKKVEGELLISDPNDPRLKEFIKEIVHKKNVTINIDMDLAYVSKERWQDQTTKMATIANYIAEERKKSYPDSDNTIFTHSAATLGLSKLSKLPQWSLFQTKIAASPMLWDLPNDVIILQTVGDIGATPTGSPIGGILNRDPASHNPERWASKGNVVFRASMKTLDVLPSNTFSNITAWAFKKPGITQHRSSTSLGVHDCNLEVWYPVTNSSSNISPTLWKSETKVLHNVSISEVLKSIGDKVSPSWRGNGKNILEFQSVKEGLKQLEPPKGGGIVLNAVAEMPFDSDSISSADWDAEAGRFVFNARNGQRWKLPKMNIEIVRTAYECVFGAKAKDPEFSIGVNPAGPQSDISTAGNLPAYYVGPIDSTLFGLVLMRADIALAAIAYGDSKEISRRGLGGILGYHSLPEMYPKKYTDQPGSSMLFGADERIVIQSLPPEMTFSGTEDLVFPEQLELAVRFGRTTPAERAYSDLFQTHYFSIIQAVNEFQDLIQCSHAIAILKWIKQNNIYFPSQDKLARFAPQDVFTPHQVPTFVTRLDNITFRRPLIIYGELGPTKIFHSSGDDIVLEYSHDRISRISSATIGKMQVHTDDMGNAVAIEIGEHQTGVFAFESSGSMVFEDGVQLIKEDGVVVGFRQRSDTLYMGESDPWYLITGISRIFIGETDYIPFKTSRNWKRPAWQIWGFVVSPMYKELEVGQ